MTQFEASETIQNSSNGETLSIPILLPYLVLCVPINDRKGYQWSEPSITHQWYHWTRLNAHRRLYKVQTSITSATTSGSTSITYLQLLDSSGGVENLGNRYKWLPGVSDFSEWLPLGLLGLLWLKQWFTIRVESSRTIFMTSLLIVVPNSEVLSNPYALPCFLFQ